MKLKQSVQFGPIQGAREDSGDDFTQNISNDDRGSLCGGVAASHARLRRGLRLRAGYGAGACCCLRDGAAIKEFGDGAQPVARFDRVDSWRGW